MFKQLTILYHYFAAKRKMSFKITKLRKWQKKHKRIITKFAQSHSLFYQNHGGKLISKKIMMDNFTTFNTRRITKEKAFKIALLGEKTRNFDSKLEDITIGLSSGTSGNRGLFLVSQSERLKWCGNILAKILPKPPWYSQKIALFLRANNNLYETINSKKLQFAYFDLLEPPEILKEKLLSFQPDILVGPPSMLLMLIGTCNPKRVISVAEVLSERDQHRLEVGFRQKIFQIYQCTEGFLAFTCSHGTLHLNEDLVLIEKEYIDKNRFIPIITDLFRKTQPIIRYRLNDILIEKKYSCPCGCIFESLEKIEGRCDDILYVELPDGSKKPIFSDFITRKIIAISEEIQEFEVVQTKLNEWIVYLDPKFIAQVESALLELFLQIGCLPPIILYKDYPSMQSLGVKLRRIRREYAII